MIGFLPAAVVFGIAGFWLFRRFYLRGGKIQKAILTLAGLVLSVPAVLFASNYLIDVPAGGWFVDFHALPGIEASSGLVGALLGVVFASAKLHRRRLSVLVTLVPAFFAVLLLLAPFAKQLFFRLDYSVLQDRWENGVCIQSSSSTCMPASCATVVKVLGGSVTEKELAAEAGSSRRGTEVWYMIRAMRNRGYDLRVRSSESVEEIPAPSVIGVKVGSAGHVVVLMSKSDDGPEIGDPLGMRERCSWISFEKLYQPNGEYYSITARR